MAQAGIGESARGQDMLARLIGRVPYENFGKRALSRA